MSEEDIDALVGKLMREKSAAMRRQAAIGEELKLIQKTVERAFLDIARNEGTPEAQTAVLEPIRKYFAVDALFELLQERQAVGKRVVEAIHRLRDLGVQF